MKPLMFAAALALAVSQLVAAHSVFTTLFVNDIDQGDGTCVRMSMTSDNCTFPVNDLASNDLACGYDGIIGVARVCPVIQGSKLTFLWREWADASRPGAIDGSHKGPCAVYMKVVSSAILDPGYGPGWFKIWASGYDLATSQWCTEKLIQDNGFLSVNVPSGLPSGYYLVRPELLALHQADKSPPNPQFYIGCAQIFLQSADMDADVPKNTVSIPGYVHAGDPSVDFNIYTPQWPYPMPGPAPYVAGINASANAVVVVRDSSIQKEGLIPNGCVLSNANWCGMELDPYTTEAGCWNASTACFQQDTLCYSTSPPTGSKNCAIWETKCNAVKAACNAGNFNGPPDHGKNLNPTSVTSYVIPPTADEYIEGSSTAISKFTLAASPSSLSTQVPLYTADTTNLVSLVTDTLTQSSSGSTPTSAAISPSEVKVSPGSPTTVPPISIDATCGTASNHTCAGSAFGSCCSEWNWCGVTDAYCGKGCQASFGTCGKLLAAKEKKNAHLKRHRAN